MRDWTIRTALAAYFALVVAPVGTALVGPSIPVFLAGCLVGGAAGFALTTRGDPVAWLTGWRLAGLTVAPGVWVVSLLASLPPVGDTPWFRILGALAIVPGLVAIGLVHHVRSTRKLDRANTQITFTARSAPAVRRQLTVTVTVLFVVTIVVAVGIPLITGDSVSMTSFFWLPAWLPVWIAIINDDSREVAVTDQGLRVQQTLHSWDRFSTYERTEDELSLYGKRRYHSKLSFDPADIDDIDGVMAALDQYLRAAETS